MKPRSYLNVWRCPVRGTWFVDQVSAYGDSAGIVAQAKTEATAWMTAMELARQHGWQPPSGDVE